MPRLLRLGRIQSHPRGTTYSAGSRRVRSGSQCRVPPEGAADFPRIFRGFSADFTRIFRGSPADFTRILRGSPRAPADFTRILRGCKCTTLPGKVAKTYTRILRGFYAEFTRMARAMLGPPADFPRVSRGPPADFPRIFRGSPAGPPRIFRASPADFWRFPGCLRKFPYGGPGASRNRWRAPWGSPTVGI